MRRSDGGFWKELLDTHPVAAATSAELAVPRDAPAHTRVLEDVAPALSSGDPDAQARIAAAEELPDSPEDWLERVDAEADRGDSTAGGPQRS